MFSKFNSTSICWTIRIILLGNGKEGMSLQIKDVFSSWEVYNLVGKTDMPTYNYKTYHNRTCSAAGTSLTLSLHVSLYVTQHIGLFKEFCPANLLPCLQFTTLSLTQFLVQDWQSINTYCMKWKAQKQNNVESQRRWLINCEFEMYRPKQSQLGETLLKCQVSEERSSFSWKRACFY